jgi:predicted ribosomally synthesized peptide with nif11-like leader
MKTLEEFIQRLQDDPAFEKQAHAFDSGDDLIAFVRREGYDFTLEQLMREFERASKSPAEPEGLAPPPADASPPPPPRPDEPEFPSQPESLSGDDTISKSGNNDFTGAQPQEKAPQPKTAMPLPAVEAEPRAGLFRGDGGRHRGFSPERLKSTSQEET